MKLLSIHLENFRLHADTKIDFGDGVTGIIGTNETGKTTILEALEWAFFGAKVTRGTKESLRWKGAPPRKTATVTVRFEVGGTIYRVERSENTAKLRDETAGKIIGDGTDPVNKQMPSLLGETHATWIASRMVRQKDVARIATMLPTERLAFIRQVMGVGKIDTALKACRKRKSELSLERDGISQGLGPKDPYTSRLREAVEKVTMARAGVTVRSKVEEDCDNENALAGALLAESEEGKAKYDGLLRQRQAGQEALERAAAALARLRLRVDKQEFAVKVVENAEARLKELPPLRERLDEMLAAKAMASERSALEDFLWKSAGTAASVQQAIAEDEAEIAAYDEAAYLRAVADEEEAARWYSQLFSERQRQLAEALASVPPAQKRAAMAKGKATAIREAGKDGCCPTCTRRLDEHYQLVMDALEAEAKEAEAEVVRLQKLAGDLLFQGPEEEEAEEASEVAEAALATVTLAKTKAEAAAATLPQLRERLAEIQADMENTRKRLDAIPEVTFAEAMFTELRKQVQDLTALQNSSELATARGYASQIPETKQQIAEQEDEAITAGGMLLEANRALTALAFDADAHAGCVADAQKWRRMLEEARVALATASEALRGAEHERDAAMAAIDDYYRRAERLVEVEADHLLHERVAGRLADFRVAVASTIRPEMEELMSGFVHLLTDGRHEAVTLTEDFEAILHEGGVPQEVVSGGTEDIAALAMRLAISQMSTERAGHPLSLLILDEPFGSLDETRRGNVITLLRLLKKTFKQTIVISHVAETRDAVDHAIELEYDEARGASVVRSA